MIKESLKCLNMMDLDCCIPYLKNSKFKFSHLFNSNQILLMNLVKWCSHNTNIVSKTMQASIPCVFLVYLYLRNKETQQMET